MCHSNCVEVPKSLRAMVTPLLNWYQSSARKLPWRTSPTPYRVLVSEVMLQQTRVETVKPYFERFMAALPTIQALAQAEESQLFKLWEGLGYYRRVQNLQKAAQEIVSSYDGKIPQDYSVLLTLPGIGEYTAGAVASIVYHVPVPAIDGNVLRVLSRLLNYHEDVSSTAARKYFRSLLLQVLPTDCPGKFNQAMMELGATVCLPRNAVQCSVCPLTDVCAAFQSQCMEILPIKAPPKQRKIENRTVLIFLAPNQVLLRQRPARGLLAKLWEFPHFEGFWEPSEVRRQLLQWNVPETKLLQVPPAKHVFTHLEWHFHAYLLYVSAFDPPAGLQWVSFQEINQSYAIPSAFQAYTSRLSGWKRP